MTNVFALRSPHSIPDFVLMQAEVEYKEAYEALKTNQSPLVVQIRRQLEEAICHLEAELRSRGLFTVRMVFSEWSDEL